MSLVRAQPVRTAGLWASVWKLLRMRILLTVSSFRRAKPRRKVGQVIFMLFLAAIAVGAFIFSRLVIQFLQSPALSKQIDLNSFFLALPGLMLMIAFLFNLITNFGVLLQALYLNRDMDFLIAAPLPMRAVFLSKLIQAILPGFGLFCLAALPVLFGLGSALGFNFLYYPLVVFVLACLALAAAGIASILVMAVVRVVPARRVAEVLAFFGAIISILISQSGNLMSSMGIENDQFIGVVNQFSRLTPAWSPFTWAGRGLTDLGSGVWLSGTGLTLLTILATGGLFAITLAAAEQLYYTGWAGLRVSTQKKKARAKPNKTAVKPPAAKGHLLPAPLRSIIAKDFLLLRRDLRNLSQLITPLILGFVMVISSSRGFNVNQGLEKLPFSGLPIYTNITFTLFVGWMLMFNLSTTSISREGKNYWLLNAAPVKPGHLLWAKYIVSLLPTLAIGCFFVAITAVIRSIQLIDIVYILLVASLCFAGLNGILLAFGVAGSNLTWEDPRKISLQGKAGCLSLLTCLGYFGICVLLFLGPPVLWELINIGNVVIGRMIGLVLGAVFSILCAILPPVAIRERVPMIGQPKD